MNYDLHAASSAIDTSFNAPKNNFFSKFRQTFFAQTRSAGLILLQVFCLTTFSIAQTLLDTTFDDDGKVMTQVVSAISRANDSILQPDGKIITVGTTNIGFPGGNQLAVVRYNTDGSLDPTFDGNGKVTTMIDTSRPSEIFAVTLQSDGKIVAVGSVGTQENLNSDAVIVRYNSDGSLDTTFNGSGKRIIANFDVQNAIDAASDVVIQPDGKILIAAGTLASGFQGFVIARLNSDGSFDTSFGTNSFTRTNFGNQFQSAPKIALNSDGKIILTGDAIGSKLVRYNANGLPDSSFGTDGVVPNAGGNAIRLDANGKILTVDNTSQVNTVVRRYNTDGSIDAQFGVNGARSFTFINANGSLNPPGDLAVQSDGKIVIGGSIRIGSSTSDFALTRLTSGGSLDTLFGFNGQLVTDIQGSDIAHSIFIQPDGKIVLTGESDAGFTITRFISATLNNACRPIGDFDGDGKSDLAYFNSSGDWNSASVATGNGRTVRWGLGTDRLVPADYNGDCRADYAVFRDGIWYIKTSGLSGTEIYYNFGISTDIPVPGDFDGDDLADPAVYRDGVWYVNRTRDGFFAVQFGITGDKPLTGDFDGDGKDDIAIYRDGVWYLSQSNLGFSVVQFGLTSDKPVVGDYDGDGKTDIAVFRPSNGIWYLLRSTLGFAAVSWGISTDIPVPADYDGDGKTDLAVYRNGDWYLLQSVAGYQLKQFGGASDKPVQSAFIP